MISRQLLQNGILQFGVFVESGIEKPYRLRLEMLPAYPQLFADFTNAIIDSFPVQPFDRLVAHSDTVVVAGVIAQKRGISLVYSQGKGIAPVHDLIGAYDIGHPSCLITNVIDSNTSIFIEKCQSVGLNIVQIITLIGFNSSKLGEIPVTAILNMETVINDLRQENLIPQRQAETVLDYLKQNRPI